MATQVQNRRGTTAEHSTFTGAVGELTVDTTKDTVVVHDGAVAGGRPLLREDQSNLPTSAPTTGIYNASGSLAISTGGSGRLFVDASGNVGVGAAPSVALEVKTTTPIIRSTHSTTSSSLQLVHNGSGAFIDYSANDLIIRSASSTERLRITSTGALNFVGAGTAGVTQAVSFNGSAPVNSLVIDSSGRVGVGTSSPAYPLDLGTSNDGRARQWFATTSFIGDQGDGTGFQVRALGAGTSGIKFANYANNIEYARFDSSGRLGIGTTPSERLHVSGGNARFEGNYVSFNNNGYIRTDATNELRLQMGSSGTTFYNPGNFAEYARIDSSGRLLVGTSTAPTVGDPQYGLLRTQGNTSSASGFGVFSIGRGQAPASITSGSELGHIYFTANDGSGYASISGYSDAAGGTNDYPGRLVFSTTADGASSPTERLRITSTGQLRLAGAGITFNGDTATANELDDYEEGTWTPTIAFGGNAVGVTYLLQLGTYTKIGRFVMCRATLGLTSKGSSTGDASIPIGSFPFVPASGSWRSYASMVSYWYSFPGGTSSPAIRLDNSQALFAKNNATISATLTNADFNNDTRLEMIFTYEV